MIKRKALEEENSTFYIVKYIFFTLPSCAISNRKVKADVIG